MKDGIIPCLNTGFYCLLSCYMPLKLWSSSLRYILFLLITFNAHATTWGTSEVDDPIKSGSKCKVFDVASSGSYIYNWPSKYDQVFFPITSSNGIWFCEDSGFISFIGDFENITVEEKKNISNYLEENPPKNIRSLISKLKLLETIYSFRHLSDELNIRNKRVFAYLYEQKDKFKLANYFRKTALNEINQLLKTGLSEYKKLEYLYVAANYERQFGNVANSDLRLTSLKMAIANIQDDELNNFGRYLLKLSEETLLIQPGGKLAPIVKKKPSPKIVNKIDTWIESSSTACKEDVQAFYDKTLPTFPLHINKVRVGKSVAELLSIRKELIENGAVSKKSVTDYSHYSGTGKAFNKKFKQWVSESSSSCQKEVSLFSEKLLLDFHQHMERVVDDQASEIVSVTKTLEEEGILKARQVIDLLLLNNMNYYFYCFIKDYDVSRREICSEKALPYKEIFRKAKENIFINPLKVDDELEKQKMLDGFSSIGI